jgi:hypothetical protein
MEQTHPILNPIAPVPYAIVFLGFGPDALAQSWIRVGREPAQERVLFLGHTLRHGPDRR